MVVRGQDGLGVKNMIDLVVVKEDMLHYVKVGRGMEQGLSDHNVVLCKDKLTSRIMG